MASPLFSDELFSFLRGLKKTNKKEWFEKNRSRYDEHVKAPLLAFIAAFGPKLHKISKHFIADARGNGGSMFRIYRDTRFSKDKTPYKTAASAQFRHERAKDVHAPGFYLHLEPGECFFGAGLWHPEPAAAEAVRSQIVSGAARWTKITGAKDFVSQCALGGESLKRPPRGYDAEHPLILDLKRKDFVISLPVDEKTILSADVVERFAAWCDVASPFMRFLTEAVKLPY